MQLKLTINSCLLLLAAVGFPSAHAITSTTFPGANCHALRGTEADQLTQSSYGLTNVSSSSLWVSCPIPRPTYGWSNVSVAVKAPGTMTCRVKVHKRDGSLALSRGVSIASYGSAREAIISSAHSQAWSYTMYCYLPPNGKVLWYAGHERTIQ